MEDIEDIREKAFWDGYIGGKKSADMLMKIAFQAGKFSASDGTSFEDFNELYEKIEYEKNRERNREVTKLNMNYNKALFIDLDGTIVVPRDGKQFPEEPRDYLFQKGILKAIKEYSDNGYKVCIISNQGGIQRGYITKEFFDTRIELISKDIENYIRTSVFSIYCPILDDHFDRKPNPGMAYKAAIELEVILKDSIMVGDKSSDSEFATISGIGSYSYVSDFTKIYR